MLANFQFAAIGANPYVLPPQASSGSGIPAPPMKVGTVLDGTAESEFVLCALTLGSTTTLTPGQVYQWDKDYNASLLSTASAVQGQSVGVGLVYQANVAAGAYFIWLQRAGHAPIACTSGSVAAALCETTTTPGVVNFTNSATAGTRQVQLATLYAANATFTANTVNGSNQLLNMSTVNDISVGATVTGTGIPASTSITAISSKTSAGATATISNAATANGTGVTVTATQVLNANMQWPVIFKSN